MPRLSRALFAVLIGAFSFMATAQAPDPTTSYGGRVEDENGRPLADVDVAAVIYYSPLLIPPDKVAHLASTNHDGVFTFTQEQCTPLPCMQGLLFRRTGFANVWLRNPDWDRIVITMRRGYKLTGRVMDSAGKPVPKATIAGMDMLTGWESFLDTTVFAPTVNVAFATTDDHGRFVLDGCVAHGVDVICSHPDYMIHERFAVDVGDPLDMVLLPGGRVRGRLLYRSGQPVQGALVRLYPKTIRWRYRPFMAPAITDADGRFSLPRTDLGPYDVTAGTSEPPIAARLSNLNGDKDDLQFVVDWLPPTDKTPVAPATPAPPAGLPPPTAPVEAQPGIVVSARTADTDKPIDKFAAAVLRTIPRGLGDDNVMVWEERFKTSSQATTSGTVRLSEPWLGRDASVVVVRAHGYVTAVQPVTALADAPNDTKLAITLTPAHKLVGRVVDWTTGHAVPGAIVAAGAPQDRNFDDWRQDDWEARRAQLTCWPAYGESGTNAAGNFEIDNLPDGKYQVFAVRYGSPLSETQPTQLGAAQPALSLRLLNSSHVKLHFEGVAAIDPSWLVRSGRPMTWSSLDLDMRDAVAIAADKTADLYGLAPGVRDLELLVQHPFRLGGIRKLKLPTFVVDKEEQDLQVDLAAVAPIPLRGSVKLLGAPIAMHRLLVVAEPILKKVRHPLPYLSLIGARCFVQDEGGVFDISCPPGMVSLLVVDAATGVVFSKSEPFLHDPQHSGSEHLLEVAAAAVRVHVATTGEQPRRLEIRLRSTWPAQIGNMAGLTEADSRVGIPLTVGQTEVELFLPASPVELRFLGGTGHDSPYAPAVVLGQQAVEPDPTVHADVKVELRN